MVDNWWYSKNETVQYVTVKLVLYVQAWVRVAQLEVKKRNK